MHERPGNEARRPRTWTMGLTIAATVLPLSSAALVLYVAGGMFIGEALR